MLEQLAHARVEQIVHEAIPFRAGNGGDSTRDTSFTFIEGEGHYFSGTASRSLRECRCDGQSVQAAHVSVCRAAYQAERVERSGRPAPSSAPRLRDRHGPSTIKRGQHLSAEYSGVHFFGPNQRDRPGWRRVQLAHRPHSPGPSTLDFTGEIMKFIVHHTRRFFKPHAISGERAILDIDDLRVHPAVAGELAPRSSIGSHPSASTARNTIS